MPASKYNRKEHDKTYRETHKKEIQKCRESHKECFKEYYKKNRETLLKKAKARYELNKKKKIEYQKRYRANPENREKIAGYSKTYYERHSFEIKNKRVLNYQEIKTNNPVKYKENRLKEKLNVKIPTTNSR